MGPTPNATTSVVSPSPTAAAAAGCRRRLSRGRRMGGGGAASEAAAARNIMTARAARGFFCRPACCLLTRIESRFGVKVRSERKSIEPIAPRVLMTRSNRLSCYWGIQWCMHTGRHACKEKLWPNHAMRLSHLASLRAGFHSGANHHARPDASRITCVCVNVVHDWSELCTRP